MTEAEKNNADQIPITNTKNEAVKGNRLAPAQAISEEEFTQAEKSLKRKLDLHLLLSVWVIFVMNYLDRNNIAAAKVAGIAKSLHMTSNEYATVVQRGFRYANTNK
ncbi:hypothetical protein K469DRAFT_690846 [Zopfia rhizophila CBS 207.26]|uniref:MFS general substrate transporter n=1 Tax=Zopfia rhizophila CBS 207.26 TaxID=1314779 RepID=A0A6A6DW15_9PEZI|nr:hypothetical protein K469DRAFT_690846 [Zopfia rhizophila CBS 207.26]